MSKTQEALKLALEALEYDGLLKRKQAITAIREALAEQPAQGCEFCSHPLYAGTKCKNCGREQPAIKQDLTPEQPAQQQEPVAWVDLIKEADEIVRGKVLWKRFIDGTPLANDIAVWMADFAQKHTSPPASKPWVGLTPAEAGALWKVGMTPHEFSCAIEAKLLGKNA